MWSEWPEDATHDRLIGPWYFYQRKGGHRTSTDDVLAAWLASKICEAQPPETYIDIGCGIGSVLLMTAHRLRPSHSHGVEAQAQSATMALRSVRELPEDAPPISIHHGDLRDPSLVLPKADLITGSPPYFPLGAGVLSPDPQRVACRFETRGGVEAYCEAAARLLKPEGVFCIVFIAKEIPRMEAAARAAGLHERVRSVWKTRSDNDEAFLSVHAYCLQTAAAASTPTEYWEGSVRDAEGRHTPEYRDLRVFMGWETVTPPR